MWCVEMCKQTAFIVSNRASFVSVNGVLLGMLPVLFMNKLFTNFNKLIKV